jgi:hypothetical protein
VRGKRRGEEKRREEKRGERRGEERRGERRRVPKSFNRARRDTVGRLGLRASVPP